MRTGLTKQEKTTDIWFDEKDPLIHIRTHNTDLKKRLAAYAGQHPDQCRQTDADPDTGCMEFEIRKGRFSFRLTAPYSEERRRAASEAPRCPSSRGSGMSEARIPRSKPSNAAERSRRAARSCLRAPSSAWHWSAAPQRIRAAPSSFTAAAPPRGTAAPRPCPR